MQQAPSLNELAAKLAALLPESVSTMRTDLEHNFKAVLQSGLSRMNLVSRQEFDVQAALLARVQGQLKDLEARLAALE